ncbi:uncharacterized protein LOC116301396, partial [Actinia tenebrosa]|uniref:Hexosyltransferase n=1 Tax=Actinia tenebrosa TaxID=6105 RepID=A0A6P8IHW5_ACTTE
MVAVRRIKHLVQLSAVGLLVLTFVIFIEWDEISYSSRIKRQVSGFRERLEYTPDSELLDLERELDVDRILKKIHDDVTLRLMQEDEDCNKTKQQQTTSTNNRNKHGNLENNSKTSTSTPKVESEKTATDSPTKNANEKSRDKEHHPQLNQIKWQPFPWKPNMRGQLNVHIWQAWCGNTIHDLRRNWFFPSYPDLHLTVSRLFVQHYEDDYGQRIFGFIHPPLTGKYVFALSSDDTSELWLSKDELPENVRLLAWVGNRTSLDGYHKTSIGQFTKYTNQQSKEVFLKKGRRYFIEALHKQGAREDHILVGWKIPGLSEFRHISGDSISMYIDDRYITPDVTKYAQFIPQTVPSHPHAHTWGVALNHDLHKFASNSVPNEYRSHQLVEMEDFENVLPNCEYQPSYLVNFTLKRYEGVKLIHDSAVYPDDLTILTHMIPYDQCRARRLTDSHSNRLNVFVPALTNHSLFHEGKIIVFGPDGNGSVVTTLSDLAEDYPIEHVLKMDESNATDQENVSFGLDNRVDKKDDANRVRNNLVRKPQPSQVQPAHNENNADNKESKQLLNGIRNHPVPLQHQIVERTNIKTKASRHETIHGMNKRTSDILKEHFEAVKNFSLSRKKEAKKSALDSKKVVKQSRHKQYSESRFTKTKEKQFQDSQKRNKSSRNRTLDNNSRNIKSNVKKKQKLSETIILSSNKLPVLSRSKRANREKGNQPKNSVNLHDIVNLQRIERRSYGEVSTVQKRREGNDEESRRSKQNDMYGLQGKSRTRRKLLSYPVATEKKNDDDDNADGQVSHAQNTQDAVPRFYFRPIGTVPVKNNSLPDFMYEDIRLTRLNSAREYVRRMQAIIQIYQHKMSARQISDQIYRRYGIRLSVPEMTPYLNYNPLLYHHNMTTCASDGNLLLNEDVAKSAVFRYMRELTRKTSNKYSLRGILNVEENHDVLYGDRYLMELELLDQNRKKSVRLSQYIYQKNGKENLCLPHNFQINHHATVHVIVPVKNQGRWVQYFINDMSEIYLKTRDPHLNVIIVDFSSDDIDVQEALRRSPLVRYKVISLSGPFQRAFGIQAGSTAVKNPNDIIFMCDLHLELPNNMIDIIRKHCIEGRMAFAPVVTRLHCGFTPSVPYGFWELQGYGLFAM